MGLNQADFAEIGGVSLNSQNRYEGGRLSPPIDYLLRIGTAGADWYWIVTGKRVAGDVLTDVQARAVAALRRLDQRLAEAAVAQIEVLADQMADEPAPADYRSERTFHDDRPGFRSKTD